MEPHAGVITTSREEAVEEHLGEGLGAEVSGGDVTGRAGAGLPMALLSSPSAIGCWVT